MCQSQLEIATRKGGVHMNHTTIAVDLAENVFEIAVSHEAGKVSEQLRVSRPKLVSFFAKRPAATVLVEACGSSHLWARRFRSFGHTVVLLPPHLVKPCRRGSKTDRADTKALLEAYRNEEIRPVLSSPCTSTCSPRCIACARGGSPHGRHASTPYAGSCGSSATSSPRALSSLYPLSPNSSKTPNRICPTRSALTSTKPARRSEGSRTNALTSSTSSRRSPNNLRGPKTSHRVQRGQLVMLARQLGHRLPSGVIAGLWQWTKRARE